MTTTIHPSMIAALADDMTAYREAVSLAGQFDHARGWGTGVSIGVVISPPDSKNQTVPTKVTDRFTQDDIADILIILKRGQERNVGDLAKKIEDHYGVKIEGRG